MEFSCSFEGQSVHILAYDFILSNPVIETLCKEQQFNRTKRNQVILEKLQSKKVFIEQEELDSLKKVPARSEFCQESYRWKFLTMGFKEIYTTIR